jgi:hypothetical protein
MDAHYIIKYLSNLESSNEDKNKNSKVEKFDMSSSASLLSNLVSLAIGGYAAYLSYECNTRHNMDETMKVIYAALAFFFGLFYLLYYLLFRSDYCHV